MAGLLLKLYMLCMAQAINSTLECSVPLNCHYQEQPRANKIAPKPAVIMAAALTDTRDACYRHYFANVSDRSQSSRLPEQAGCCRKQLVLPPTRLRCI